MKGKSVVILGGGGGLVAASEPRRLLPAEHRVVLVEHNPRHTFAPSFLWLMTGERRAMVRASCASCASAQAAAPSATGWGDEGNEVIRGSISRGR